MGLAVISDGAKQARRIIYFQRDFLSILISTKKDSMVL